MKMRKKREDGSVGGRGITTSPSSSAKTKKRKLDCIIDDSESLKLSTSSTKPKSTSEKLSSYDEMNVFL